MFTLLYFISKLVLRKHYDSCLKELLLWYTYNLYETGFYSVEPHFEVNILNLLKNAAINTLIDIEILTQMG